jgi:penicillin-binding protein 1A
MRLRTYLAFICVLLGAASLGAFFFLTHVPWVDLSILEHYDTGMPSILLDDEGNEWARFQIDWRKPISLKEMPTCLIWAFIAAEDHQFFSHNGLSLRGIIRSILVNTLKRKKVQGASTITQQLVRLLFFDNQKTFRRKIKEQILALALERQFTKEFILESYLNHIYFGRGIYGVEAASQRFWGKTVRLLTIDQAATLAAIIPSPVRYCPLMHPENTLGRRNRILHSMRSLGYITEQEHLCALRSPLAIQSEDTTLYAPHAREYIRLIIEEIIGKQALYTAGFIIQTTLNTSMQRKAHESFKKHITSFRPHLGKDIDGAVISLSVHDGGIKALVGGYDFTSSQFNRAVHAQRQLGSVFKPLVYAAALENKLIDFRELNTDEPITIIDHGKSWTPNNFNRKFEGTMTLAHALANSRNTIAIKMLLRVGLAPVIEYAHKFRLASHIEPYPSLALGCIDSSALRVAALYNTFANKGLYHEPYIIAWIKDRWGKKIWKHKHHPEQILSWPTTSQVVQALTINFERLRKRNPSLLPHIAVYGKTGTTNQSRTCWFAGSTPSWTTVVYIGRDTNQPLGKDVFPSTTAFPIWLGINTAINHPIAQFSFDPSLEFISIHYLTGALLDPNHNDAVRILVPRSATLAFN